MRYADTERCCHLADVDIPIVDVDVEDIDILFCQMVDTTANIVSYLENNCNRLILR